MHGIYTDSELYEIFDEGIIDAVALHSANVIFDLFQHYSDPAIDLPFHITRESLELLAKTAAQYSKVIELKRNGSPDYNLLPEEVKKGLSQSEKSLQKMIEQIFRYRAYIKQ